MTTTDDVIRLAREADCFCVNLTGDLAKSIERLGRLIELAKAEALAEQWQPIETAPQQTRVLVTWDDTWKRGAPHIEVCETGEEGLWFYSYDGEEPVSPPTHYRPLPPPPSNKK